MKVLDETNKQGRKDFLEAQEMAVGEYVIQLDSLVAKRQAAMSIAAELDINKGNLQKYKDMLAIVERDIEELEKLSTSLKGEKDVLVQFNCYYVNFIADIFATVLIDTKVNIHKINNETGEIKEDFFITYKDKEYSLLSNSERIKVALEIAKMFNTLLNKKYPTVVDDYESILKLPIINTQMIICRVEDIDIINVK